MRTCDCRGRVHSMYPSILQRSAITPGDRHTLVELNKHLLLLRRNLLDRKKKKTEQSIIKLQSAKIRVPKCAICSRCHCQVQKDNMAQYGATEMDAAKAQVCSLSTPRPSLRTTQQLIIIDNRTCLLQTNAVVFVWASFYRHH